MNKPIWKITLRDAIAEEMAIVAERDLGVAGLKEPLDGLIDEFGCMPETRERRRRRVALDVGARARLAQ